MEEWKGHFGRFCDMVFKDPEVRRKTIIAYLFKADLSKVHPRAQSLHPSFLWPSASVTVKTCIAFEP